MPRVAADTQAMSEVEGSSPPGIRQAPADTADIDGVDVRQVPLYMTDDDATAAMVRAALEVADADR